MTMLSQYNIYSVAECIINKWHVMSLVSKEHGLVAGHNLMANILITVA